MKNLNNLFAGSASNIINSVINAGGVILGEKFQGRSGYFTSDYERAAKIASIVEKETGLKGFISTEELPKYGITEEDRDRIKEEFGSSQEDTVIIVAGAEDKASRALEIIRENIK